MHCPAMRAFHLGSNVVSYEYYIAQVGMLQHTAECALAVTFLQLRKGTSEGGSPEVCCAFFLDCCNHMLHTCTAVHSNGDIL